MRLKLGFCTQLISVFFCNVQKNRINAPREQCIMSATSATPAMNDAQRLQLNQMIQANGTVDYTESIRELKHSQCIRDDVNRMLRIIAEHRGDDQRIHEESARECYFLFTFYTDIYNKLRKEEISIEILHKFIDVLHQIELGAVNQHEGSFLVGTLLKELYVDSAVKKGEKLDAAAAADDATNAPADTTAPPPEPKIVSWTEYKSKRAVEQATSFDPCEGHRSNCGCSLCVCLKGGDGPFGSSRGTKKNTKKSAKRR